MQRCEKVFKSLRLCAFALKIPLLLILLLTGCGYRFQEESIASCYPTISVPYVQGDRDGRLTAEIIKKLSTSSTFDYVNDCGHLILCIKVIEFRDENIGFRYDRDGEGNLQRSVVPAETRSSLLVDVRGIDCASGKIVLGPAKISARVDFDHEYYSSPNEINVFSLGQLSDSDEAQDVAYHPLNVELAQKIVDYINNTW